MRQTILHDPAAGTVGNCYSACLAMILDLPVEEVPHFAAMPASSWHDRLLDWLRDRGYGLVRIPASETAIPTEGVPLILCGTSPRGVRHAIVRVGDKDFDPHPSDGGLAEIDEYQALARIGAPLPEATP